MLLEEIVVVYSENRRKHINTLCGRKALLLNVKHMAYIVTEYSIPRQRLGKHGLEAGITVEVEINLLGNGKQTPFPAATNINKGIPVITNRIIEDS
jgi:hypothetical protein